MKKNLKLIISKVPVFIFCVLFIAGYNAIFDAANSTVGVAILTALLMFLKCDFGYNVKQAVLCLPVVFLLMTVSPKAALINPYFGILINFLSITFILILTCYDINQDNHIAFLLGYIFCGGYDVSGVIFNKRVISVLLASILVGAVYYLTKRKNEYSKNLSEVFSEIDIHSYKTQWYLRLAITLTLVMFLGDIFNYPRTMWISFAVLSLIHPHPEVSKERIKYRLPSTIIGCIIFIILFNFIIPENYQGIFAMFLGFGMMFLSSYYKKNIGNSINALIAALVFFPASSGALLRIISNVIGVIIVLINEHLFKLVLPKIKYPHS